jgi:hypothetical protein
MCVWTRSSCNEGVSMQLVVSAWCQDRQCVYRTNHQNDEHGAMHLALRVRSFLEASVADMVELCAYTKEFELPLPSQERVPLHLHGTSEGGGAQDDMRGMVVSWLDDRGHHVLKTPITLPTNIMQGSRVGMQLCWLG